MAWEHLPTTGELGDWSDLGEAGDLGGSPARGLGLGVLVSVAVWALIAVVVRLAGVL